MKKTKALLSFMLALLLVVAYAFPVSASEVKADKTEDGRIQVTMEFKDAQEAEWAIEYIGKMKAKNVFSGYEDGSFKPNQPVTRAEAIVTAVRLLGLEEEAKMKSSDMKLHFKDAELVDKSYKWAKGYIVVALENGLFDATEEKVQPDKPASRVWIASLLVKALDLQKEALSQMTAVPDFKDAEDIPAGSVGYINVAVEHELVSGYPDQTFKPNKNVTRAEMATLLLRTSDGLLENSGAVTVSGTIDEIKFTGQSVTEQVYQTTDGTITIKSFNGDILSYSISSELLFQFHKRFIRVDQLLKDDNVTLVIQDNKVIEAALIDKEIADQVVSGITEFKLEIESGEEKEYKIKYKNKNGKLIAEVESKSEGEKNKINDEEAVTVVQVLLDKVTLTPEMTKQEIVKNVLTALNISESSYKELKIEIKFSNGKEIEVELENEGFSKEDLAKENGDSIIREFELEFKLSDDEKSKFKYKNEDKKIEAEVEKETKKAKEKYEGDKAAQEIETLLESLNLSAETTKQEIFKNVLSFFEVREEQIKEFELKIKFSNGKEIELEVENEDEEDEEE